MKSFFFNFLTALIFLAPSVFGQTAKNERLISEIRALRNKIVVAIKERDRKTLEEIYADDFTHTHASGQVDDKTKRLAALAASEKTIESAEASEVNIRIYNKNTAVAVGRSAIADAEQQITQYRWTIVYTKSKNAWRVVASQATKIS